MSDIEHLKRLEDLQVENKRLTERLSELSETVARLREAQAFAEVLSSGKSES